MYWAKAFAPGDMSCIFKILAHEDAAKMHSLGLSFTVDQGVEVRVCEAGETAIYFNGERINFPTVAGVVGKLGASGARVEIETSLPLSCGFGLSGASALATAYALNALLKIGWNKEELAMVAHISEVENLTGLGDVCAQYHGGCLAKLRPGHPLGAESLRVAEQPIFFRYFSPINTADILRDQSRRERINRAADVGLAQIEVLLGKEDVAFDECISLAKTFAVQSGLLEDAQVKQTIAQVEAAGGHASMIMLGNAVFSTRPFNDARQVGLAYRQAEVIDA
jgi:pantoate kinase